MMGLGAADLTVRTHRKSWAEHPDLDTNGLLWTHRWPTIVMRCQMLGQTRAKVAHLRRWTREEREAIVDTVIGTTVAGIGNWGKATTGVAAACYGLFVGVPEIVLVGISLDAKGHSYDSLQRARRQTDEDKFVLERLKSRPELFTTEAALAKCTDIRQWREPLSRS